MQKIVAIAGSLRKGSFNKALLRAAVELAPDRMDIEVAGIEEIPLYNGDVESAGGVPEVVERLKDDIAAADGLLIATPEYNHSISGVLKNAIDWLSRPPADISRVFADLPVALIGATPGPAGTRYAQTAWLPIFQTLRMRPFFGKSLYVERAKSLFDDDLHLVDADMRKRLAEYLEAYSGFIAETAGQRAAAT